LQFELSGAQSGLLSSPLPFSLNFTIRARLHGAFTVDDLKNALEKLRFRHPLLAVRIAPGEKEGSACFTTENVPSIPLRVVERTTDLNWVREVEQEISQPSNYLTGPLFRCVWLKGTDVSDLVIVCDHITADGYAGIYALRDLLTLLADPDLQLEPCQPELLGKLVPPAMRNRINTIVSALPGNSPGRPEKFQEMPAPPPLRVIPFELDETETSTLVGCCRQEGVTVQSALCAAFAMPFAERQPDVPIRWVESPVNIRGHLVRPIEEVYGNYISLIYSGVDCAPGRQAWDVARQFAHSLNTVTEEQLFTIPIVMMAAADQPLSIPVVDFNYDLSISNLGRITIPVKYGQLCIESIYGPTMNVSTPAHRILGVTTFEGCMRCTFTSRDPDAPSLVKRSLEILSAMNHQPIERSNP
jgi:NRPS condensation-like uncharacterized protein